jgi:2-alkyl-3-oxoalkanoate reductase
MKVFVAGATGAIGLRLVPALIERGHDVVGMTRSASKTDALRAVGAEPVVADALDRKAVIDAVVAAAPDAVIHQLTDLRNMKNPRRFDNEFAGTNALRTGGTDHLLEGARAAGVRRFIAQSYGSWIYDPAGSGLAGEEDRLDPRPPRHQRRTLTAIVHLEKAVAGATELDGIVLRYGSFYGPGTSIAADGDVLVQVRKRAFPIVGDGDGVWSFIHVDDAVSATVAALEHGTRGVYNVCDDEPARVASWLPALADAIGAPRPRRIPTWLGWLVIGDVGISLMTRIRGMSNAKARRELEWEPRFASWREGFSSGLGNSEPASSEPIDISVDAQARR